MKNRPMKIKNLLKDLLPVMIGELIVAALVCVGGFLLSLADVISFDYRIITGALLGAVVMSINYAVLIYTVDKQLRAFQEARGSREMSEEEAEEYAKANSAPVQKALAFSTTMRTASMIATLVIAFILDWFNPIATAIPLFAFRFVLSAIELIRSKNNKAPDPEKFIKYEFKDENNEEKESDQ